MLWCRYVDRALYFLIDLVGLPFFETKKINM